MITEHTLLELMSYRKLNCFSRLNSTLGDSVVLALANAMSTPIIVFSSIPHYPVIQVNSRKTEIPTLVYITYNHCGVGHYDTVEHKLKFNGGRSMVPQSELRKDVCGCNMWQD